jgi:hypothetical protein
VILLRHSAEKLAHRIVSEQSNTIGETGVLSESALRIPIYGYLVSQVFGSQGGDELGKLYNDRKLEVSALLPEGAKAHTKSSSKELFELGIELSEKDRVQPRELTQLLLTKYLSSSKNQSAYQPK